MGVTVYLMDIFAFFGTESSVTLGVSPGENASRVFCNNVSTRRGVVLTDGELRDRSQRQQGIGLNTYMTMVNARKSTLLPEMSFVTSVRGAGISISGLLSQPGLLTLHNLLWGTAFPLGAARMYLRWGAVHPCSLTGHI